MHNKKTGVKITQEDVDYAAYLANLQTVRINTIRQWEKTTDLTASAAVTTMVAWNDDDTYDHKVRMLLGVLPKEVMEQEENVIKSIRTFIRLFRRRT